MDQRNGRPIVFFDGVCGLCNRSVDWLLTQDHQGVLRFAPIQGETAARMLGEPDDAPERWSMVLLDRTGRYERSDAVIRIARHLGGWWRWAGLLCMIPRGLRDAVYRWIARNRYRFFGRREACRVPSPAERDRFLP